MNSSCLSERRTPAASAKDLASKHQKDPKQAIKDFLLEKQRAPSRNEPCPRCGGPMRSIDTVLWFYGDEESFNIRLPACHCAEIDPDDFVTNR